MSSAVPTWRVGLDRLRREFESNRQLELYHLRFQPVGAACELPSRWREPVEAAEFRRESVWQPGCPDLPTYEHPERAVLYGSRAATELFDRLATEAWQAVPGSPDGKAQAAPFAGNDTDRWLTLIDRELSYAQAQGLHYLEEDDWVIIRQAGGGKVIEPAGGYALPRTYGPIRNPDPRPPLTLPFERWRVTRLTVNLFTASTIALDLLLANPDAEGVHLVSCKELDDWQRSPAFQNANHLLDFISLANGRRFPLCRADCRPSTKALPSICPKADPKLPVELRPDGDMLAVIEACYRSQHLIGDDQSLHWVGRQQRPETTCTCDLMARPDEPRSAEWQSLRQLRQTVVALVILLRKCAVGRHQTQKLQEAGAVMGEQSAPDFQPLDRLEQRIADAATTAGITLPDGVPIIPDWARNPDGLPQAEGWVRWQSEWRAVRVAVETRLADLDCCPLPCQAQTVLQVDTREVPMEAPTGTPSPLGEALEAVAQALFQAAEMRRCPPTARLVFEQMARTLSDAYRTARERYAAAELYLQAVADNGGQCALQDALSAVCRVNDAVGHVMLKTVPFHRATAHILSVPAFDLAELLRAMRRQTSRAALRLRSGTIENDTGCSTRAVPPPSTPPAPVLPELLSAADLAHRLEQPPPRVETFLRRYRDSHTDCYVLVKSPRRNEPSYLYRTAAVWSVLLAQLPSWRTLGSRETSSTDD